MEKSILTCVSCYYPVRNKHDNKYWEWFENTLSIRCPYVFFTTKEHIEKIKELRKGLPTYFIEYEIEEFYMNGFKDLMVEHPRHCPSHELNMIWNEKMMMEKVAELNPFGSEWFQWMDAGICVYRNEKPPDRGYPDLEKLKRVPKDRMIYSSSNPYYKGYVSPKNYYHHVSGTSYLIHMGLLKEMVQIYKSYLSKLVDRNNIWTDQVIWTHIYKDHPEKFYLLGEGYGECVRILF